MSDESDQTIIGQEEEQESDPKTVETNNQVQSEKSFQEKIEEFQNGEREQNPWGEIPKWKIFGGLLGAGLAFILSILLSYEGSIGLALIFFSLPIIAPLVLTEFGRQFLREVHDNFEKEIQGQQSSTQSKPKRICSNCGWQNPQQNSFCHDCGSELEGSG